MKPTSPIPDLHIALDWRGDFAPGDELTGRCHVRNWSELIHPRAELSVVWYTAGQGEEDMAVHFLRRLPGRDPSDSDPAKPIQFAVTLPSAPLSYDGLILKVCWAVRLRVKPRLGRSQMVEAPFRLGSVSAAVAGEEA
ncbi:hypothetical protein Pla175_34400 [Pirellulimonas nuda]|uniref:Arrestin-like N-terminal domain-containing protein n=1 Tax=Pirellulimonas nuda TaxID=2528009 RepID=A0A518DEZ7_9BACT|nr:hypothetical protein [Pirellulimonas nuda]QDU90041.1 hypothetical protein Pla175_34400 [Pirellulimonas nuda]